MTFKFALRPLETKFNSNAPSPEFGANLIPSSVKVSCPPASSSAVISIDFPSSLTNVKTVSLAKEISCVNGLNEIEPLLMENEILLEKIEVPPRKTSTAIEPVLLLGAKVTPFEVKESSPPVSSFVVTLIV